MKFNHKNFLTIFRCTHLRSGASLNIFCEEFNIFHLNRPQKKPARTNTYYDNKLQNCTNFDNTSSEISAGVPSSDILAIYSEISRFYFGPFFRPPSTQLII